MNEYEHLRAYELVLTVRSPLYVGSGKKCGKTEYLFNPRNGTVQMLDQDKFFAFLAEHELADKYESFILSGDTHLYDFLRSCNITDTEISGFCLYRINAADALDGEHSLKDINTFVQEFVVIQETEFAA